jgi:hypothetical protein
MVKFGAIGASMKEWIDAIRLGGSAAAHEQERYDKNDATDLR